MADIQSAIRCQYCGYVSVGGKYHEQQCDAPPVAVPAPTEYKPCDCTNRYYCQKRQGTLKAGFHCQEDAPPIAKEPSGATELPERPHAIPIQNFSLRSNVYSEVKAAAYMDAIERQLAAAQRTIAEHAARCHELRLELRGKP